MPDAEFEKTFSDLAFARLRDKAPGLLDHLVGFQLLDKSEDNTHAVGVWGFKVGDEWLYAPVFFLNGQLKGDDLLYLKSQDAFVPLKENWINYLLNRRPYVLGEAEMEQPSELGIRQPDFNAFARPPYTGSKYASAGQLRSLVDYLTTTVADDFKPFLPVVIAQPGGDKRASLNEKFDIPTFIKKAGKKAASTLMKTMQKNAGFADAVLKFYRMEDICSAAKEAFLKEAEDGDKMIEGTAPKVRIMMADRANVGDDLETAMLSDEEKEKLQRDQYLVKDRRGDGEVSNVYHRQIAQTLQNPHGSAYCRVLMSDGTFKERMVITNTVGDQNHMSRDRGQCLVIDLDNGNRLLMADTKDIFVDNEMHDGEDWIEHFNSLPEPSSVKEKDKVVFVNEKGDGTVPFFIERRIVTADGQVQLYGEFDNFPHMGRGDKNTNNLLYPKFTGRYFNPSDAANRYFDEYSGYGDGRHHPCFIVTNKPGNKVTQIGKDFFVPNGFKAIKISKKDIEPWKLRENRPTIEDGVPDRDEQAEELANPQTLADIEMHLFKSAQAVELQPVTDGIEWWIGVNGNRGRPMSKIAALKTLIIDHALREKDATNLLKLATRDNARRYMVKKAQPTGPSVMPEATMGSDSTLTTNPQMLYPQEDLISANETPLDRYGAANMDMDSTFYAQQAAQQGQKEVLDTSVISGLVKVMDPDSVVDQYIGDLMLGLDRVGRILFMYYWHFNKFKDRYGSQDMPELEDNLKNVFDNMGDLTLFLKQKTIEPEVSGATAEAELEQVI